MNFESEILFFYFSNYFFRQGRDIFNAELEIDEPDSSTVRLSSGDRIDSGLLFNFLEKNSFLF
jgi:hypothetical protein